MAVAFVQKRGKVRRDETAPGNPRSSQKAMKRLL
jgi:hypothetical protein